MTGLVFATLSKYIEIGNIVNKPKLEIEKPNDDVQNKRQKKLIEKSKLSQDQQPPLRNIKHFSSVQNKPIYEPDLFKFKNRTLINIEVPSYWHLNPDSVKTEEEQQYDQRMKMRVIYVKLKQNKEVDEFGRTPPTANIYQISELFTKFGDINVSTGTFLHEA